MRRMLEAGGTFLYLTVMNENYPQTANGRRGRKGILRRHGTDTRRGDERVATLRQRSDPVRMNGRREVASAITGERRSRV